MLRKDHLLALVSETLGFPNCIPALQAEEDKINLMKRLYK